MTPVFISYSTATMTNWRAAFPAVKVLLPSEMGIGTGELAFVYADQAGNSRELVLQAQHYYQKIIVLSSNPHIEEAIAVIKLGAAGYGHSHSSVTMLQEMALVVGHGGLWVGKDLLKRVMSALTYRTVAPRSQDKLETGILAEADLSERERAVAHHVASGASNQEISVTLGISERTVKAHITSIYKKLGVRNRVELALRVKGHF